MKTLVSLAFGAVALGATIGFAQPADAAMGEPVPIGIGEILVQYDSAPTDSQKRACERNGGKITQLQNDKYVCVRRGI